LNRCSKIMYSRKRRDRIGSTIMGRCHFGIGVTPKNPNEKLSSSPTALWLRSRQQPVLQIEPNLELKVGDFKLNV
jgi:hypothetical protein